VNHPKLALTAAAAVLIAALAATNAQQHIVGGRALDSSLQQGSSGFNTGVRGFSTPTYRGYRPASVKTIQQRQPSIAVSSGGGTRVATYGRGGYNTGGTALTKPTYNSLSQGVRVQRAPTTSYGTSARGYTPPSYSTQSYRAPGSPSAYSTTARPTNTYRAPSYPTTAPTPTYTPPSTTNPASYGASSAAGLSGLARPTYSTFRVGP
jgi:hypothetical protein